MGYYSNIENAYENPLDVTELSLFGNKNNKNIKISQLLKFPNLIHLDLSYSGLETLDESIGELVQLEVLEIGSNSIKVLPNSIGNLINLKKLVISWLSLSSLPKSIVNLKKLEDLQIKNNNFSHFPEEIFELKKLKKLLVETTQLIGKKSLFGGAKWNLSEGTIDYRLLKFLDTKTLLDLSFDQYQDEELFSLLNSGKKTVKEKSLTKLNERYGKNVIVEKSDIYILGKTISSVAKIKKDILKYGITIKKSLSKDIDFILLGVQPDIDFDTLKRNTDKLVFEKDIITFLDTQGEFYLKNNSNFDLDNLKLMLLSNNDDSIDLAIEIIKLGGLDKSLEMDSIIAYQSIKNTKLRKCFGDILKLNIDSSISNKMIPKYDLRKSYWLSDLVIRIVDFSNNTVFDTSDFMLQYLISRGKLVDGYLDTLESNKDVFEKLMYIKNHIKGLKLVDFKMISDKFYLFENLQELKIKNWKTSTVNPMFSKLTQLRLLEIEKGNIKVAKKSLQPLLPENCKLIINGQEL